jgi:hypothetical protein
MKNEFKKQDANGKQLSETIGKGIDEIHAKKAEEARKLFVGVRVSDIQKKMFIASCKELGYNQSDVLNLAISETILKASKL